MNILALDLATECGFAMTPERSGVWSLAKKKGEGPGAPFLRLERLLTPLLAEGGIELVIYEYAWFHRGAKASHFFGGLEAITLACCEPRRTLCHPLAFSSLKKHATGSGRAKKPEMIKAAHRKWPQIKLIDDNHADALWLLDYAQEHLT